MRKNSNLYFWVAEKDEGRRREFLLEDGGLIKYIQSQKILERRVCVEDVSEIQKLLDEGKALAVYKIELNYLKKWRFRSAIIMNKENTRIDGEDIVFKGSRKRADENNIFPEDQDCVHQFMVVFDPEYDLSENQRRKGINPIKSKGPVVIRRPSAQKISDEEAARRADELMNETEFGGPGVNPLVK